MKQLQQTTTDDPNLPPQDTTPTHDHNGSTEATQKLLDTDIHDSQSNNTTEIVYTPSANPIATSVLQYTDSSNKTAGTTVPVDETATVLISTQTEPLVDATIDDKDKGHIIYTHGDKTYVESVKDGQLYDGATKVYATTTGDDDTKQPLDLIYEDGGKTVIYTTTTDPKSLELYSSNELNVYVVADCKQMDRTFYELNVVPLHDDVRQPATTQKSKKYNFFRAGDCTPSTLDASEIEAQPQQHEQR